MYRWIDHTAELELEVEGPTREAVFVDALAALAELLEPDRPCDVPTDRTTLSAEAQDDPALLAEWMGELLYAAETTGFVAEQVEELTLVPGRVEATVRGRRCTPSPLVKAVTYHGLRLEEVEGGFRARVVLDV